MVPINKLTIGTRFKTYPNGEEYVVIAHNSTRFGSYRVKARSFQTGIYHYFDWHILVFAKPYDFCAF